MTPMLRRSALILCLLALTAAPASADGGKDPMDAAREQLNRMARTLDRFLQSVPRFGAPRLNDRGDIVIPRKPDRRREGTPHRLPPPGLRDDPGRRYDI